MLERGMVFIVLSSPYDHNEILFSKFNYNYWKFFHLEQVNIDSHLFLKHFDNTIKDLAKRSNKLTKSVTCFPLKFEKTIFLFCLFEMHFQHWIILLLIRETQARSHNFHCPSHSILTNIMIPFIASQNMDANAKLQNTCPRSFSSSIKVREDHNIKCKTMGHDDKNKLVHFHLEHTRLDRSQSLKTIQMVKAFSMHHSILTF